MPDNAYQKIPGTYEKTPRAELLRMTTEIVSVYVGHNTLNVEQIPEAIQTIYATLDALDTTGGKSIAAPQKPAVPIRKSITPDYIICLEDGKKLKMLKRHIRTTFGMSPEEYRTKWGLPADYPMVAPNYAARRSDFAKKIGLGKQAGQKRGRKPKK